MSTPRTLSMLTKSTTNNNNIIINNSTMKNGYSSNNNNTTSTYDTSIHDIAASVCLITARGIYKQEWETNSKLAGLDNNHGFYITIVSINNNNNNRSSSSSSSVNNSTHTDRLFINPSIIPSTSSPTILTSDVQWNTLNPSWVVGKGALPPPPFIIRVYRVERAPGSFLHIVNKGNESLMSTTEPITTQEVISTLARPEMFQDTLIINAQKNRDGILICETKINSFRLIGNLTLRDLERINRRLPINSFFFVVGASAATGRLMATPEVASIVVDSLLDSMVPLTNLDTFFIYSDFSRLVSLVGGENMSKLLDYASRIRQAREQVLHCERLTLESLKDKVRLVQQIRVKEKLNQEKNRLLKEKQQLIVQNTALRLKIDAMKKSLENGIGRLKRRAELEAEDSSRVSLYLANENEHLRSSLTIMKRCTNAKRLLLTHHLLCIYPIQLNPLSINQFPLQFNYDESTGDLPEEAADGLGLLAHLIQCLATFYGITLRYVPVFFGSKSILLDPILASPTDLFAQRRAIQQVMAASISPHIFPLFIPSRASKPKFLVAIKLLYVDLMQLIDGMRRVLNLPPILTVEETGPNLVSHLVSVLREMRCM
jgi:hypothetical protein